LKLTETLNNDRRTITADNFFSSIKLVDTLLNKNIRYVGTLRKNKTEIPQQFLPNKTRGVHSSIFGFDKTKTLVSYVPKPYKSVILISSEHYKIAVNPQNDFKPDIIEFYNKTKGFQIKIIISYCSSEIFTIKFYLVMKGSVDALDQKIEKYTCRRKTLRWTFNVFMYMLDVAAINSTVLYSLKNPELSHNRFRRVQLGELAVSLIKPQAEVRLSELSITRYRHIHSTQLMSFSRLGFKIERTNSVQNTIKKRCSHFECRSLQSDSKFKYKCSHCDQHFCLNHCEQLVTTICSDCLIE
jgi:hypothetical protein